MQLLIDAGNTRIKWGVPVDKIAGAGQAPLWLHSGSVSHAELANLDSVWRSMTITRVLISNVAGATIRAELSAILQDIQPAADVQWFVSQEQVAGIHNTYRNPAQLGCDRLASMVGAHYLFSQQDVVVATCGTATTVDAVTAQGQFQGGMILPGLKMMAESLARNTAQLPQVAESIHLAGIFADNTDQAIVSGCISAQVGAIRRAVSVLEEQQKQAVTCVISGGAAPYLLPHLGLSCQHVDNLVLTGLFVVAQSSPD